jgi:hypothetical protein
MLNFLRGRRYDKTRAVRISGTFTAVTFVLLVLTSIGRQSQDLQGVDESETFWTLMQALSFVAFIFAFGSLLYSTIFNRDGKATVIWMAGSALALMIVFSWFS